MMKISEIVRYLNEVMKEDGDLDVSVEVTSDLNFNGDVLDISDLVTSYSPDGTVLYVQCFK